MGLISGLALAKFSARAANECKTFVTKRFALLFQKKQSVGERQMPTPPSPPSPPCQLRTESEWVVNGRDHLSSVPLLTGLHVPFGGVQPGEVLQAPRAPMWLSIDWSIRCLWFAVKVKRDGHR